ncbi:MAG: LysR family transcriptional regulator [Sulfurifustaceae bacterium]
MPMTPNLLDHLTGMAVFAKVVEAKGFSNAARQLGLTKSAVSKRVASLERSLGVTLLHRTTRALSLTEAGRVLYRHAADTSRLAETARGSVSQLSETPRGTLRVTTAAPFGNLCLAPLLPKFFARYPDVRIHLSMTDRLVDLADEGFDLAIRLARKLPDGLIARKLMPVQYVVCAAPSYLKRAPALRTPQDLARHNCLYFAHGDVADKWVFDGPGGRQTVRITGNLIVNHAEIIRDAVVAGMGVGLISTFTVARELKAGRLKVLLPKWKPQGSFGAAFYAVWLPRRYLPSALRVFIDFLVEHLPVREQVGA